MLAIELGLPRPIPDLCLHRARTHNAALINICASHHSTSQLTSATCPNKSFSRTTQTPWAGCAHPVPHASSSQARARSRAAPMGLHGWATLNGAPWLPTSDEVGGVWPGQRVAGAEAYCRRPRESSDVAELKGSEEGQEREGSRSVGGLGPSPLATPSSE